MGTPYPLLPVDHHGLETTRIDEDVEDHLRLGMRLVRWGLHGPTGKRIAMLRAGPAKLELIEVATPTGAWVHTAFLVSDPADLPATHATLVGRGLTSEREPFPIAAALAESSFLRTRGGQSVQLIAYHPGSPDTE